MIGAFLDTLCIMTITLDTSDNAIDHRFLFHMHILVDGFQLRELSDHWLRPSYVPITRDMSNSSPNSERLLAVDSTCFLPRLWSGFSLFVALFRFQIRYHNSGRVRYSRQGDMLLH